MSIDRHCIIKACAQELLRDYGHDAYEAFCQANPAARDEEYEATLACNALTTIVPALCGPFGRVMP